jgi:hypothetical protein
MDSERLLEHVGHDIRIVTYGKQNVSLECYDCYELIYDKDYENGE